MGRVVLGLYGKTVPEVSIVPSYVQPQLRRLTLLIDC